ncbi:hypothetical protein PLICRDRAFT_33069 [Plicaturopsis crispa FD-325 SS-3]|uniref:Uncharacterized protein n=1 Tax=Plicaturopsis crispa FD-325 SS-3 TaxID=944288 RepID=A0A0C9T1S4_PLICR|nr:hypothetical protein PLICRDRAFT_33069 [Plicaturopsis crispa FD-325 SS-3]
MSGATTRRAGWRIEGARRGCVELYPRHKLDYFLWRRTPVVLTEGPAVKTTAAPGAGKETLHNLHVFILGTVVHLQPVRQDMGAAWHRTVAATVDIKWGGTGLAPDVEPNRSVLDWNEGTTATPQACFSFPSRAGIASTICTVHGVLTPLSPYPIVEVEASTVSSRKAILVKRSRVVLDADPELCVASSRRPSTAITPTRFSTRSHHLRCATRFDVGKNVIRAPSPFIGERSVQGAECDVSSARLADDRPTRRDSCSGAHHLNSRKRAQHY